ncbi:S-layer homology domain-containing protein [Nodularia sp. UHCC 0506]|uniref:S-layer homology domain-containing protein n=1 Tax=Nodularia sp. UHCC 0506 TaxID=3110243 RepID=UPI002B201530|nr:S-layer homology domain-containing protein [Nodularia sp. UHCC 0506]MEA5514798.1 S-layer homology domain-containing protein [Nodularia sp. UHCC 0506]
MSSLSHLSALSVSLLTLGMAASLTTSASAQNTFPDVPSDYWAKPFIERLAERNIIVGYPDGTFRPEQAVQRDEFAAMIRQAFEQEPVRQIEDASAFQDVPEGYWASLAIESAYQQGFMSGYPGGFFGPNQPVSRVDALVTLTRGLNLAPEARRVVRRPVYLPLAMTSLMQPLVAALPQPTTPVAALAKDFYVDAQQIPQYAINDVGIATQKNLVVNYPNPRVLEPNEPLRRATATAFIHQTLVAQDRIEPLPSNVEAYNYIVRPAVSQAAR